MAKKQDVERYKKEHALIRMRERFFEDATPGDMLNIARMIQSGETWLIRKVSNARSKHLVHYKGRVIVAIYDKVRKIVLTVTDTASLSQGELWDLSGVFLQTPEVDDDEDFSYMVRCGMLDSTATVGQSSQDQTHL